jgi:diaminohydroxyphosphoribosylaminopyrimidine deaminase/5-amino-6-(5-phosphoribosylamino)uracil reductase
LVLQPFKAFASADGVMQRAIELARRGIGFVEPNPPVGAVIVDDHLQVVAEGWHERFGGPHAEVQAISQAGTAARGATLFVTLEPCCHFGKTPPCVDAIVAAGLKKVVVGMADPFPQVAGKGIERLRSAGIEVEIEVAGPAVRRLTAPFCTLVESGRPYVHAKWAMTLDGRIASVAGESKWISNARSRAAVHALRGRMDALAVGIGTALADDPLLTARPPGPRVATRIVFDGQARLSVDSQLVRTAREVPVLVATTSRAPLERVAALRENGVEVFVCASGDSSGGNDRPDPGSLLAELGRRRMTNLLVEGGSVLLGSFFDAGLIDEVHVFVAPKLLGGAGAKSPLAGAGRLSPPELPDLVEPEIEVLDGDVYIHGPLRL